MALIKTPFNSIVWSETDCILLPQGRERFFGWGSKSWTTYWLGE